MKEEWLMPGAIVPVDVETTAALVAEIKRLIGVVGGMALNQQRPWVGLTDEEIKNIEETTTCLGDESWLRNLTRNLETKLKEKNHG